MISEIISLGVFASCFTVVSVGINWHFDRKIKKEQETYFERIEKTVMINYDDIKQAIISLEKKYEQKIQSYQSVHSEMYNFLYDEMKELKGNQADVRNLIIEMGVLINKTIDEQKNHDTDIQNLFNSIEDINVKIAIRNNMDM